MGEAIEDLEENLDEEITEEELETDELKEEEENLDGEGEKELEPWQVVDEEEAGDVPVGTHIKMKSKLKGRISERDDEIANLRSELEALKKGSQTTQVTTSGKRPLVEDFDTDEEYHTALDTWDQERLNAIFEARETKKIQTESSKQYMANLETQVDGHYERAAELVEKTGMSSEIFKQADSTVRQAVETLLPKKGDFVVDQLISMVGEGSEKVFTYLGRNKTALAMFKSKLIDDPSGMSAAIYLGQQKERLTTPKKMTSSAPPPAGRAGGDDTPNNKGLALKRKYDAAHKKNKGDQAYKFKQEARKQGVDVSSW